MGLRELLRKFFKASGAVSGPVINRSVVVFSGLFSYTKDEKYTIQKRDKHFKVKCNYSDIIRNQYYPVFRKFILNDCSDDYLQIVNENTYLLKINNEKVIVDDVRLSFFDDTIGLGIYSFKIRFDQQTSFGDTIQLLRDLRRFQSVVFMGNTKMSVLEFIENNILRCEDNPSTNIKCRINKSSNTYNYSGDKLKTFIAIEVEKFPSGYSHEEALYEIGTLTDYSTSKSKVGLNSPASSYFESIVSKRISVFQNWSGLALFDSFVLIGEKDYMKEDQTISMICESYFKIFLFNIYVKFYLFKTNSDLEEKGNKFSKEQLYSFLQKYDLKHISYNFLPNLIHVKIREAMEIDLELNAVRSKIEMLDGLRQERFSRKLNGFLIGISVLTIISVLNDLPDVFNDLLGRKPDNLRLWGLIIISLIFICFLVNFRKKK
ncbi:hypothetical protein [Sphingobacterium sp. UGAL515B_05]|uniref:hypothetical protein n=1 Tax=Sphingobacterium sp. UGAL515B_05 TaxID=2986767 RepID=UPI002953550B|nr:hypothetical protein [Sphingobacterium sp. UGAL515B_05]WON93646.1 hypothetical protein OK025_20660 [Sphingobacterium sp. UGAL515B_05]